MSTNVTITKDEAKKIRRGIEDVFNCIKQAKSINVLVDESVKTLNNSSAGSVVDFANKQISNCVGGYRKLSSFTAGQISVLLQGMARASQAINDNATVKELKDSMGYIEDINGEVQKAMNNFEDTNIKVSDDTTKPLSYSGLLDMVDSFKGISKSLEEVYGTIEGFKKDVEKTDYAGSNDQCRENLKNLQNGFADVVNDQILPLVEGYGNNVVTFLEEHKANMNKQQLQALEESKALMAKFTADFGENLSTAKKSKVEFEMPQML